MKSWLTKPLGEVAQVTAGDPAPQKVGDFSDDGIPFVRMQDVGRFGQTTCLIETKDRLSKTASQKLKRFPVGSILVPKSGASIRLNHRAILGIEAHVVSHLAVIAPHPSLNTRFAYYWLCSIDLSGVAHDADLPSMKTSDLAKLMIPMPPLEEQERIVKLLDEADELRKLRTHADRRTDALIPALFNETFGDVATNSKNFPMGKLTDNIRLLGGAAFKSQDFCNEGIPVIRIGNANKGEIDLRDLVFLPNNFIQSHARYLLKSGDIVITLTGTVGKDDYGNVCYINNLFNGWLLNQRVAKIEFSNDRLSAWYIFWAFRQPALKAMLIQNNRGVRQANISNKDILSLEIPVPPLALQKEFAQRVAEIRKLEVEQATSRAKLDSLFQSMLHRAFNGEL